MHTFINNLNHEEMTTSHSSLPFYDKNMLERKRKHSIIAKLKALNIKDFN